MIPQGWKFRLCGLVRDVFVGGSVHSEMNAVRRIWWMTLRNLHWWAAKAQWLIRGWVWNPIFEEAQNEMWLSRLTAVCLVLLWDCFQLEGTRLHLTYADGMSAYTCKQETCSMWLWIVVIILLLVHLQKVFGAPPGPFSQGVKSRF